MSLVMRTRASRDAPSDRGSTEWILNVGPTFSGDLFRRSAT